MNSLECRIETPNLSEDEILSIVEPIMDSCLEGSNEGDHKKHTKYFTNRMKSIVTPEELKRQLSIEPKVYWTKESLCAYLEETTQLELFGNKKLLQVMTN